MSENYAIEVGATAVCLVKGFLRGQKGFGDASHGGSAATPREVWLQPHNESDDQLSNESFLFIGFDDQVDGDNGFPLLRWRQANGWGRDYEPLKMDLWEGDELWAMLDLVAADVDSTMKVRVMVLHGEGKPPA